MLTDNALLQASRANLEDDAPRRVDADRLLDRSDPCAGARTLRVLAPPAPPLAPRVPPRGAIVWHALPAPH